MLPRKCKKEIIEKCSYLLVFSHNFSFTVSFATNLMRQGAQQFKFDAKAFLNNIFFCFHFFPISADRSSLILSKIPLLCPAIHYYQCFQFFLNIFYGSIS